jgi:hypothetical protein
MFIGAGTLWLYPALPFFEFWALNFSGELFSLLVHFTTGRAVDSRKDSLPCARRKAPTADAGVEARAKMKPR